MESNETRYHTATLYKPFINSGIGVTFYFHTGRRKTASDCKTGPCRSACRWWHSSSSGIDRVPGEVPFAGNYRSPDFDSEREAGLYFDGQIAKSWAAGFGIASGGLRCTGSSPCPVAPGLF